MRTVTFCCKTRDLNPGWEALSVLMLWQLRSAYHLHGIFGWDVWDKWNGLFLPLKTGQNTMLYHLSKNDLIELCRLGRLVSSTVGERMAQVRFVQMVQLIPVIFVETKKEEYLRKYSFYSGNFHRVEPFHLTFHPKKNVFLVQMVSTPALLGHPHCGLLI